MDFGLIGEFKQGISLLNSDVNIIRYTYHILMYRCTLYVVIITADSNRVICFCMLCNIIIITITRCGLMVTTIKIWDESINK